MKPQDLQHQVILQKCFHGTDIQKDRNNSVCNHCNGDDNTMIRKPIIHLPVLTLSTVTLPVLTHHKANPYPVSTSTNINKFAANYHFIRKYKGHSLHVYSTILISVIFFESNIAIIPDISNLLKMYLYNIDDEIHELAFLVYKTLKKLRKPAISKKNLLQIIEYWSRSREISKQRKSAHFYIEQLASAQYMTHYESHKLYKMSMLSMMGFANINYH